MEFEYKVIEIDLDGTFAPKVDCVAIEKTINKLACDGWELVNVSPNEIRHGVTCSYTLFFKRQK